MHNIYMQKYLVASKGGNHEPSRLLAGCGLRKQPWWVVITPENVLGCRTCDNKSLNKDLGLSDVLAPEILGCEYAKSERPMHHCLYSECTAL